MTEETTISTPVKETVEAETAPEELDKSSTSTDAPETEETTAETETEAKTEPPETKEKKLYAGKYESIEELEKGYGELNKAYTQANQIKAKYDELLKQQQSQQALNLEQAQKAGFNTVEEQEIANNVQMAEFNAFWSNLNGLDAEVQPQVQQYLTEYYKTGNTDFLKAAKVYFPADFLEKVAVGKKEFETQLKEEYKTKQTELKNQHDAELAEVLRNDFSELLADVNENKGKAQALKAFCDADFIQSKEDMQVFADIYKQIADFERAAAIKEYEAQKVIEETKQKAVISNNGHATLDVNTELPTADDLRKNPKLYEKAVKKWGMEKVDEIIMKG